MDRDTKTDLIAFCYAAGFFGLALTLLAAYVRAASGG